MADRIIVYIDGFNLYFGLRDSRLRHLYWLDVTKMASGMLKAGQTLVMTKYFTARVSSPEDKVRRQTVFMDALATLPKLKIIQGKYMEEPWDCPLCRQTSSLPSEKMTDVSIAVTMMADAFRDDFDAAIVVSGDSDLVPAVKKIKSLFPTKRVVSAFPPNRISNELKQHTHGVIHIDASMLRRSQLPDKVVAKNGHPLFRPQQWSKPTAPI